MADGQDEQGDQARKELAAQAKLLRDLISIGKDNRGALCFLPEMIERLLEIPEANVAKLFADETLETSRYKA